MTNASSTLTQQQQLAQAVMDPRLFARGILGYDLWEKPNQILEAISVPNARVAVRSCHASGKSHTAGAIAVPWFMVRYADAIVATTAPTWAQVVDVLWKEVHTAVQKAKQRIELPDPLKTEWRFKQKDHYAIGLSTTESERFSGFHAPHVLIILDEAPGVKEDIWEAIDGIRAGGDVRVLALGNPTIGSGPFFRAFGTNRSSWRTFTIDGMETPNLRGYSIEELLEMSPEELDDNPRPYLITKRWVVERYKEWGPNSPLFMARVRGSFPTQSEESLIALGRSKA